MDSDSGDEEVATSPAKKSASKTSNSPTKVASYFRPEPEDRPRLKPQAAKRLKKDRRLQNLLQKLDKKSKHSENQNPSSDIEEDIDESKVKRKKKKRKDKNGEVKVQNLEVDGGTAEKSISAEEVEVDEFHKEEVKPTGRHYSVSIALPGSIIDNAQSPPLKAYLAGQIARAAAIFNVDEIIVYDDTGGNSKTACEFMARVLQYLECPQYLRKYLFPLHPDLQYAGVIAPLDIPHHLRRTEALPYREGMVSSKPTKSGKEVSYISVGLDRDCKVHKTLPEGTRVTVKFDNPSPEYVLKLKGKLNGKIVSPHLPRTESGIYWGYMVRMAESLTKVMSDCPFKDAEEGGYDLILGTSEKGSKVSDLNFNINTRLKGAGFKHMLIVFGGVEGLEYALENDETSKEGDVSKLFDHYVNTCPGQGSRTIRTEEAILISMTALDPFIKNTYPGI